MGGSEEVREDLPDMWEGEGEPKPVEPKLESKDTSEPEVWESEREDRELEMGEVDERPVLDWQCFNMVLDPHRPWPLGTSTG